jgi:hypothetical protein
MFARIYAFLAVLPSLLALTASPAEARIEALSTIADLNSRAGLDSRTLLLFDIDMTLMRARTYLGSDVWFEHLLRRYQDRDGLSHGDAVERAQILWHATQAGIEVDPIETTTAEIHRELKLLAGATLGLTARNPMLRDYTLRDLRSLDLGFFSHPADGEERSLDLPHPAVLHEGIAFVGQNSKGAGLSALLPVLANTRDFLPARIVMIDDRLSHLESMQKVADAAGIPFLGFHYTFAEHHARQFKLRHPLTSGLATDRATARGLRVR